MMPVRGRTMLNFIHWVAIHCPKIERLRDESEENLLRLVEKFERGKIRFNRELREKWRNGFHLLFRTDSRWAGYDIARKELERIEAKEE